MKAEYKRTNYPSDLSDREWEKIKEFFPAGNKSKYDKRNLVEAVIYVVKTGCQWRALPHDYPPYSTVYNFYSRAKQKGTWEKIMQFLVKETRIKSDRTAEQHSVDHNCSRNNPCRAVHQSNGKRQYERYQSSLLR